MIHRKLERLGPADRRLLAAAAVQGPEFDSAVIAGRWAWTPQRSKRACKCWSGYTG